MATGFKHSQGGSSVAQTQNWLKEHKLSAILLRATDRYFNEYVPKALSIRTKITGFDGSVGDAIITPTAAYLYVDGRYTLQAKNQAPDFVVHVCQNNQSIEGTWLSHLASLLKSGDKFCIDPSTMPLKLHQELVNQTGKIGANIDHSASGFFNSIIDPNQAASANSVELWQVGENIAGFSSQHKLGELSKSMAELGIDALLLVKLDDIAWILNLRSNYFPFQMSVPGIACLLPNRLVVGLGFGLDAARKLCLPEVELVAESEFFQTLKQYAAKQKITCGIDSSETSLGHLAGLRECGIEVKAIVNPVAHKKAIKNEKELLHMRCAFKKADQVVHQTQAFAAQSYQKQRALTEGDVDDFVQTAFKDSGSSALSFRPICAGGQNGAVIHYGTPNREEKVAEGALFLLDTGAYYQGGYATDLTRTFLSSPPEAKAAPWQKQMFTLVLKASINGLSARLRRGTIGMQLDAMVRAPLWQAGLDFAHGTGHGVGINVHEFPPRIGPTSTSPLLENQVFSIEPGLYFEGLGGVRIENLATIVADPKHKDFVRVLPLTFCPFDQRLIDESMLSEHEQRFLRYYDEQWRKQADWPDLPPLDDVVFGKR